MTEGLDHEEPCIQLPLRLRRYLRILVSDAAAQTLLALAERSRNPPNSGEVEEGWIRVYATREQLMEEEGVGRTALHEHLACLEDIGAVRREQSGRVALLFVRELLSLADSLEESSYVQEKMLSRYGVIVGKVQYIKFLPEQATDPRVSAYGATDEYQAWEGMMKERTSKELCGRQASVYGLIAESKQRSVTRRQAREDKPKAARLGQGRKNPDKIPLQDQGPYLAKQFVQRVEALGLVPERDGKKIASIMARLRDAHGGETVRQMIEFYTSPLGWEQTRKLVWQLRDSLVPRVGDLSRFDAEIRTLMEQRQAPKRSGGATERTSVAEDDLSF